MITLSHAIREFMVATEADGAKDTTLAWYQSILNKFIELMKDVAIDTVSGNDVRKYLNTIKKDYARDTMHAHKRVQHRFWKWCALEYGITNPMRNIKYPSPPPQKPAKAANFEDISLLFDAMAENGIEGIRDMAILSFLVDTGCRRGGLASLTMDNLDMDAHTAFVHEKGDKYRTVYFTDFTARKLQDWLDIRPQTEPVFINMRRYTALTDSGITQLFARYKKRLGIKGRINPHSYRHAFAREYLKSGGDLKSLSQILGHASIEVTADMYALFLPDELKEKHNKHTPTHKLTQKLDNNNEA